MGGEGSLNLIGFLKMLMTAAGWVLIVVSTTGFLALPNGRFC